VGSRYYVKGLPRLAIGDPAFAEIPCGEEEEEGDEEIEGEESK